MLAALRGRLCAVKEITGMNTEAYTKDNKTTTQEIETLKRLTATDSPLLAHLTRLLDSSSGTALLDIHEQSPNEKYTVTPWYAMSAVHGISISDYNLAVRRHKLIPEAMVAHIALQLHDVVSWLHSLQPPVRHGDIHGRNVLLNLATVSDLGFPNVVLIDFGAAHTTGTRDEREADCFMVYRMLYGLATRLNFRNNVGDSVWRAFVAQMEKGQSTRSHGQKMTLEEWRELWYSELEMRRDSITRQSQGVIRWQIDKADRKSTRLNSSHWE